MRTHQRLYTLAARGGFGGCWCLLAEQPKSGYAIWRADVHLAVDDRWRHEFVARSEVVAGPGLVAVIQFLREVSGRVCVQHGCRAVLDCPENAVGRTVRGNTGRGPGVGELVRSHG